ncbi:MAG: ATPase [Chitinophagaceae bacterium]|nr:MAG: ATPase [Chitinophagaceae bacterium]
METKRIVILGPESTGKTTLSRELAEHYNTKWVPEFARDFLISHGMNYDYDDLLTIAHGQLEMEMKIEKAVLEDGDNTDKLLFIDTNMYVMQVWCEFVFQKCHSWILEQIATRSYDLYLLCNIDLPWVKDSLREYPDLESRISLYNIYKDILISQNVPWIDISGEYSDRLHIAIDAVDKCFN